jgi:hypothetical protein
MCNGDQWLFAPILKRIKLATETRFDVSGHITCNRGVKSIPPGTCSFMFKVNSTVNMLLVRKGSTS